MELDGVSAEDFIYAPTTVALVFDSEAVSYMNQSETTPYILRGKPLAGGYFIIYVDESDVERVVTRYASFTASVFPFVLGLLGEAELSASGITQIHRQPYLNLKGGGVLLGFVGTGIDYTKNAFRYEDGSSKIQYIWDQSIRGGSPPGYLYGTEYNNSIINEALRSENPHDIVPHEDTSGHGTFLASVAASREQGEYLGAAPDSEIIVVKLKKARPFNYNRHLIPRDQKNAFATDDFMMGIQYILDKAQELRRPVAICIALGTNVGTHDGFTRVETYLSRISGIPGVAVCTAAGNEANARHHTHGRIPATGNTHNIEVRASNKEEDIYIQLLNPISDRMSVSVTSPAGELVSRIPARSGIIYRHNLILERSTVIVEYLFPIEISGTQVTRVKILAATPGVWTITVYGDYVIDGTYHAWLPVTGFISPETYFLAPTPNYTIVTPATSMGPVTCGAYNSRDNSLYAASSWGPTRLPAMKPDLVAPGVDVAGILPGGYGKMSGTSVASAITAGASALLLQWGIVKQNNLSMDNYHVRAALIAGCERYRNNEYPNHQWGYGKLNLYNTFRSLRPR